MTTLTGYLLGETLYEGTRTLVYRGTRTADRQAVIIKFLRNEYPPFSELVQFRNQYTIAKNLDLPGIVKPLALETHGNGYALVMPDEGYMSLGEWRKGEFSIVDCLTIAVQLADALHYLIGQRIIHKDLKPANILIHPKTGQIQLIDFSISSLLPKEQPQLANPNVLEGTLAYISPEQTGRMNRGIDYRTDFYSLGVTLYELLTGELPFPTDDPMELVHCHMARPVTFSEDSQREIPERVRAIILKLMAKNSEDRYQSALGLKYDLEKCLSRWKETQNIEPFELGERDICDRFLIPERLYGREDEVKTLLEAFERVAEGKTEMMLVAGFSGIGKTAVVSEVHKPITRQKGYFIQGKFDQFNRNVPFSAFVQAFRSLMGQLLGESDAALAIWKEEILEAVGVNGQVILEVIPELERIIGEQPTVPELSGSAAQNRFNLLFGKFVGVFTTKEHPLVLFLDDLQWADSASLNLMKLLMGESESGYLLVLGAYRDNEVFPAHPLMLTLDEIAKQDGQLNTLTLAPLSQPDINRLVADTLLCSSEIAVPLSQLVYQKTQGNPFFSTQFLQGLHGEGCITFEVEVGYWQCDLAQVRQLALTDDVVEFMVGRLRKLPEVTQNVLKLAACIGNRFDLATLAVVCDRDQVAADLWRGLQDGFVIPENETYKFFQGERGEENCVDEISASYRFLHDRVQQAAYSLINDDIKLETHLTIGRLLLGSLSKLEIEENIFDVTSQLNMGHSLICDRHERDELARLNLVAGCKAKASTAYLVSTDYFNLGIELLEDGWNRQYDLMLSLYLEVIESEYINTHFDKSKALADLALQKAKYRLDTLKIHELQIQYYIAKNERKQAVEMGLEALKILNIELNGVAPEVSNIEALADLPELTDPDKIIALRILITTVSAAVIAAPDLLVPIAFEMVNICISSGNSKLAAYAYGFHAWMLCSFLEEIDAGYRFGKLAIKLLNKFDSKKIKCKVLQQFNVFIRHRKEPLENMKDLVKAVQAGIEVGDIEYACYSAQDYCILQVFLGQNLESSLLEQKKYINLIRDNKQEFSLNFASPWLQLVCNLSNGFLRPGHLIGDFFDETERIPTLQKQNDSISLFPICFIKMYIGYLFGEYEIALKDTITTEKHKKGSNGFIYYPAYLFYFSLVLLACCSNSTSEEKKNFMERVNCNQEQLSSWCDDAPFTYQHKCDLVDAESYRVLGKRLDAMEKYDRAIAGARTNEYLQEEALANELAAKFYLDWGKEKVAAAYMQEAYYCYARWGAKAKTDHLEANYPQLLRPILQQASPTLDSLATLASIYSPKSTVHSTSSGTQTSTSNANTALDLVTILKASQAISSTIDLNELLGQLTQIILQNSGGDRCAIILCEPDSQIQVRAIASVDTTDLSPLPLQDASHLPIQLIQYVKRAVEMLVMDSPECDLPVVDHYLAQQQPASVLCLPLVDRTQLRGVLYVENQATSGVFHSTRLAALKLLATQAAIALENARLYQQSQNYAQQLEESQLQLVQSEKMSALGNLVAGVAHEINNPLGFVGGNIKELQTSLQDITEYLELYESTFPSPGDEIEEKREELDIEFLLEDLPKMLDSMKVGCDRIGGISTSLRTFSRTDTDSKFKANLHDGIDSTLLILKYRLKAKDFRPEIEVIRDYGELPEIDCFPGQLNQVFMNLLANAIDMFDEIAEGQAFKELQANPQRITIRTHLVESHLVEICISDNGKGMSEEVCSQIFERKFTTKAVGKGTGLGLAIARQVENEPEMYCLDIDLSDRKQTQKEQARLLAILEATSDFVGTADPNGQVLYLNQAGRQMVGIAPEELIDGRNLTQNHPQWVNQLILAEALPETIRSGSWLGETAMLNKNGQEIPVSQLILAHRGETGEVEYFSTIARNISQSKRQENALRFIVEGTVAKTGNEFFQACVQHLAEIFQVRYAFITELVDETCSRSRMLAFWAGEGFAEPYEFDLAGTPCSIVFQENWGIFPDTLQTRFPEADGLATLDAESYIGVVIVDSQGKAIGNLGLMDTKPLADDLNTAKSLLQLFATRVGAEMERKAAEAILNDYADRQTLLNQLANQIRNSLDGDTVIATTVRSIRDLLEIEHCGFIWYDCDAEPPMWNVIQEAKLEEIPSCLGYVPATLLCPIERSLLNSEILRIDDVEEYEEQLHRAFLNTVDCKSEIILPIHTRSQRMGAIICVNYHQVRPWTDSEVELLQAVRDQLAIAIDQAELYAESRAKSQELQQTLQELQRTQAQMVQSEKMSSLGHLVAGIAHEINNPVNFIHGNIIYAGDYTRDLLEAIALYQQEYPHPTPPIVEKLEAIDLNFLRKDLPKLLASMKVGTERICEIVKSLRLFSRLDEAEVKLVDIHDGIDSTLTILQSRLKAQSIRITGKEFHRPEIEIVKDYGNLPKVECFAGQLNQVFMNVLVNAIDALEEQFRSQFSQENHAPKSPPDIIRIITETIADHQVAIRIIDNGTGIPESLQQRIFDPFFTTKPVGQGTGMGMSISYQIVVEKHGGQLSCSSTPGQGTEFLIQIPIQQY